MASDPDRKKYWDLVETLMWIATRDESRVAALRDKSDEIKTALVFSAMREEPIVIEYPHRASGTNGGADLEQPAPLRAGRAPYPLDDLPAKVQSGRVRMTAIRDDGGTNEQTPVPLAELNDATFRLPPSRSVAPVGLWSRSGTLVWRSPQFLRADVVAAWPARNRKTAAASAAILRYLRSIMSARGSTHQTRSSAAVPGRGARRLSRSLQQGLGGAGTVPQERAGQARPQSALKGGKTSERNLRRVKHTTLFHRLLRGYKSSTR